MKSITILLITLLSSDLFAQKCIDLSYIKNIPELGVEITHKQIECKQFIKTFYDILNGEVLLEQTIHLDGKWHEQREDNEIHSQLKRNRFTWSHDGNELFEEYTIEGHKKVAAKLRSYYRHKSMVYQKDGEEIQITGHNYHRYEFTHQASEVATAPINERYSSLK